MDDGILSSIDPGVFHDATLAIDRIRSESVRLADIGVEHGTLTARAIDVGELR